MKRNYVSFALAGLAACQKPSPVEVATVEKHVSMSNNLDVLFVIDNSASTADKQKLFASNFAALAQTLDSFPTGRPNLHIGVVSTSVGTGSDADFGLACAKVLPQDDGLLQNAPRVQGCTAPNDRFLIDVDSNGTRTTNFPGTLADAFSCIAQLGSFGCGFEAPLEAMKHALDGSRPENVDFLRDDSDLAVIILADEDDCSVADKNMFSLNQHDVGPGDFRCQPLFAYDCDSPISATSGDTYYGCHPRHGGYLRDTSAYVDFLHTIKDPSQVMVAVIAGDPSSTIATGTITQPFMQSLALEPSCQVTLSDGVAIGRPALRLDEFRQQFGDQGAFESVCQTDYTGALQHIGVGIHQMMSPCLDSTVDSVDTDPSNPGRQPNCVVTEHQGGVGKVIPACKMFDPTTIAVDSQTPCWWVDSSSDCTANGLQVHIEGPPAGVGSYTEIRCAAR
jgi:hypothetical protein